ncbi:radical SAM protein, partial [Candidatus Omnitrophota bacterium]
HDRLTYLGIFHGERAFTGPQLIQIDLTMDCNNDCIGCWCNSPLLEEKKLPPEEKKKHIPFGYVVNLINDAARMGTTEVYLAGGGEPFMYPYIMDVIRHIKEKGMTLYINTNFTLVDMPKIQEMVGLGVDHFTVSIWAGTPATYSATHPNKSEETFHHLENMLKYLQSLKVEQTHPPYVKIYNVISKLNYQELDAMYEFTLRTKSESVEFTVLDTIPGKTDVLMLDAEEMAVLRDQAEQLKTRVSQMKMQNMNPPLLFRYDQFLRRISDDDCVDGNYDKNIIDSIPCYVGWVFSRIIPNGDVNGCLKGHRAPLGNINKERFCDVWNSPAQRYFRKKTYTQEKTDDFFSLIGNDTRAKVGCHKGCDDLGRNQHTHRAIEQLMWPEKIFWKTCARIIRGLSYIRYAKWRKRKHFEFNTPRALELCDGDLAPVGDLEIRGIKDKYRAFKGPAHVVIDLTNRCGNSCLGCWMYSPYLSEEVVDKKWLQQELSRKDTMRLISDLADMGTEIIRFTGGGEPLLHKDFSDIVCFAKEKGLRVAVTTCLPPGSHKCKEALSLVDELAVSIWAGDEKTYVDMHPNQSPEHFQYITNLIHEIQKQSLSGCHLTTCHVLTNKNIRGLDTMISHTQSIGANAIYFALVDPIEGATDKLLLSDEDHAWLDIKMSNYKDGHVDGLIIENYDGLCKRLKNTGDASRGHYDKEHIDSMPCYIGWHFSRILANGNVVPCCRGVKKIIGNIRKQRFKKIWHGKEQEKFRNNALLLSKFDSYFKDIECFKTCDNWMHNKLIHERRCRLAKG